MITNRNKKRLFLLLFIMSSALSAHERQSSFLYGCELYSKTLDINNYQESTPDKKKKFNLQIEDFTHDQMISLALHQVTKLPLQSHEKTTLLDRHFLKKMEIFCGEENKKQNLFNVLDNTITVFGKTALIEQLAEPNHSTEELNKIQTLIATLVSHKDLADKIEIQLQHIKKAEVPFFTYFQESNPINETLLKKVYWGKRLNFLNANEWTLELGVRLSHLSNLFVVSALPLLLSGSSAVVKQFKRNLSQQPQVSIFKDLGLSLQEIVDPRLKNYKEGVEGKKTAIKNGLANVEATAKELNRRAEQLSKNQENENLKNEFLESVEMAQQEYLTFIGSLLDIVPQTAGDIAYLINAAQGTPKYLLFGILGGLAGLQAYTTYTAVQDVTLKQTIYNYLQTKLIAIASYVRALQDLAKIIENNDVFSCIRNRSNLIDLNSYKMSSLSNDCKKLLKLLSHATFSGDVSIFSLTGKILKAHKLMEKVKEELIPACFAAGHLDAYLSTAKLYKKHEHLPSKFCFAKFDTSSGSPYISAQNFWNPFLNPSEVIKNTLELGLNKPNNIVLSGPNTGGKSTLIKALLLDIYLAQSLTIAPADSLTLAPYAHLNCYLNITDDLTAGTSLFKAEILRAKTLITAIRNLKNQEFSFTVIDEIFSGTSPQEGEEAAVQFAQELCAAPNSLCIIATHFPRLMQELPSNLFKNYHVTVFKNQNNTWERIFLAQEGPSFTNIALDLLKEEGVFNN